MDSSIHSDGTKKAKDKNFPLMSADELRRTCLDAGADDVGFVEIEREALSPERADILRVFNRTGTIISLVKRVNRESIQSPSVSVADYEFSRIYTELCDISHRFIKGLNASGIRAVAVPPGFPMDMDRWPGKVWEVAHKTFAVEAGLGHMGLHRVVIHPNLGDHILLDTILIDARLDRYDQPLAENPCIECRLCVAVCPVRAISKDGEFDFLSCAMHNYHELFGGFQEWIEEIAASNSIRSYRSKFRDSETASKWQSLTYGHFYRCSYCMAVCPAGTEPLKTYHPDKRGYVQDVVKPLKQKKEPVYVIAGTLAEKSAQRNKKKEVRFVRNTIRPASIATFLHGVPLLFNPEKAEGLALTLHFEFTGKETRQATIVIAERKVTVTAGLSGNANLRIRVDSEVWVRMLNEEISPFRAMITGKLRLKGNPAHLATFKKCIL